jgi:glycosyltransferase involved in cell wall biosynthesis
MWRNEKVSVIFPTYNEKESIRAAIVDFFSTGVVDEIVVVNNNAAPGTSEEVAGTGAREVMEPEQGYGAALQRGMREATGDILIWSEPDGTFVGRDVMKLLTYSEDFDVVFGSRTSNVLIWSGANMGWFLRIGNYAVAKMMEWLFNTTFLSDVGCTMRLLRRSAYEKIRDRFTIKGSHFGPECMLLVIQSRLRFIELPLNYLPRIGESSVTGDPIKAFRLGCRMIAMILLCRFKTWFGGSPAR